MGGWEVNKSYTTLSGDYYVGMTAEEAKKNGTYKKSIGIDFVDLDTNKDNHLSIWEIKDGIQKERKRNVIGGACEAVAGTVLVSTGSILEIPTCGVSTALVAVGYSMFLDGATRECEGAITGDGNTGLRGLAKQYIKGGWNKIKNHFTK